MAQERQSHLDHILFENVSYQLDGFDPTLKCVDLELPMDQTVIIQSSNPSHAVHMLEILAGRREPQSGKVRWTDQGSRDFNELNFNLHELVGCYFESNRPDPHLTVLEILKSSGAHEDVINELVDFFEFKSSVLNKKFRMLTFENQKLVMLILPTLKLPQMLVLEDPALGLSERTLLTYLDWVHLWQRQGQLRHIFLTNNHPTAARHLQGGALYVEDGLVYHEEKNNLKKIVHF